MNVRIHALFYYYKFRRRRFCGHPVFFIFIDIWKKVSNVLQVGNLSWGDVIFFSYDHCWSPQSIGNKPKKFREEYSSWETVSWLQKKQVYIHSKSIHWWRPESSSWWGRAWKCIEIRPSMYYDDYCYYIFIVSCDFYCDETALQRAWCFLTVRS